MNQVGRRIPAIGMVFIFLMALGACSKPEDRISSLLSQAWNHFDKGEYGMAQTFAREILDQDNENWAAVFLVGRIALKLNDSQTAARAFSRTLNLQPDHREAQLALAELLLSNRQFDQSRSYIERLIKADPEDRDALILKSRMYLAEKQPEQAGMLLDDIIKSGKSMPQLYELSAIAKMQQQDTAGAEKVLQEGLAQHPEDVSLHLARVRLFHQTDRKEKAAEELQGMMALAPESIRYPLMLADLSWQGDHKEKAEQLLTKIITDDPQSVERRLQVANFFMDRHEVEKTGMILKAAIDAIPGDIQLNLAYSRYYQLTGQEDKAIETLLACLEGKDKPKGHDLQTLQLALAQAYYQWHEMARAMDHIEKVLADNPDHLDAVFLKGRISIARGQVDQAISAFQAVLAKRPQWSQGYLQLARAFALAGKTDSAAAVLQRGVNTFPTSKEIHLALARAYLARKDYKGAEAGLLKVLKIDPSDYKIQAELGDFYVQLKETDQAEREYAEIVSKFPANALGYMKLASLYESQGLSSKAIAELKRGYRHNRQSNELLLALVSSYLQADDTGTAMKLCKRRLAGNDKDAFAHNLQGQIHARLKQNKQAERSYGKAIALAPQWNEPSNNLAALMITTGRKAEAICHLEAGLAKNPKNPAAYLTLARFSEEKADYQKAMTYYEQGLAVIPEFGDAAHRLSILLCHHDTSEEALDRALQLSLRSYQLNPGRADIIDTLGWIYHLRGDDSRSEKLLRRVADQVPDYPSVNYHLAMVVLAEGQKDKARRYLETALKSKDYFFIGRADAEQALDTLKKAG